MKEKKDQQEIEMQPRPRKANECFIERGSLAGFQLVFDEFWREGELALLFGASGTGKSVLAVQIAEALARGRNLEGFRMLAGRRKVLYVDLAHSDAQFRARYAAPAGKNSMRTRMSACHYRFAESLYRDRPPTTDKLAERLSGMIKTGGFRVVIIDDLAAIRNTHGGTRETLKLMRDLKKLRDELNVSILVLSDSDDPGKSGQVNEADLGRSRILCTAADSVFAIGRHPQRSAEFYILQTRSKSSPILWTEKNAPRCRLAKTDTGFLGFQFDERFEVEMDAGTRESICAVKALRDARKTYRAIAEELKISKSHAARLFKRWTPAMDRRSRNPESQPAEPPASAGGFNDRRHNLKEEEMFDLAGRLKDFREHTQSYLRQLPSGGEPHPPSPGRRFNVRAIPFAAGLGRRTVYDLKHGIDAYGVDIYIEKECPVTGRPIIWYKFDKQGRKMRCQRTSLCIRVEHLDKSPYV